MRIVVSGSSGLVGSVLLPTLGTAGHEVAKLVRPGTAPASAPGQNDIAWDPPGEKIEAARLEGAAAVVHLAGGNIPAGRWTAARKAKVRRRRVNGTQFLSET